MSKEPKYPDNLKPFSFADWDEEILNLILDIEGLKGSLNSPAIGTETISSIQHWVKIENAIWSNRIEGNQTTAAELEAGLEGKLPKDEKKRFKIIETTNHYKAEEFIDKFLEDHPKKIPSDLILSEGLVRECHKILMSDIPTKAEGVKHPGEYRMENVTITGSPYVPPPHLGVPALMTELIEFCRNTDKKNRLINTAIAHHRFAWIHPFENGNGRSARLFTYAMLKDGGFHFNGMVSLPRAFEREKESYYKFLNLADNGDLLAWIKYFLKTLLGELQKWEVRLKADGMQKSFDKLLLSLRAKNELTTSEMKTLSHAFLFGIVTNGDVQKVAGVSGVQSSRILSSLTKKGYLTMINKKRGYSIAIGTKSPLINFFLF